MAYLRLNGNDAETLLKVIEYEISSRLDSMTPEQKENCQVLHSLWSMRSDLVDVIEEDSKKNAV